MSSYRHSLSDIPDVVLAARFNLGRGRSQRSLPRRLSMNPPEHFPDPVGNLSLNLVVHDALRAMGARKHELLGSVARNSLGMVRS